MKEIPTPTSHDLDINSISTLRGIDSYDLESNTGIWHIPDMPDHVIEKTGESDARFVTLSGRVPNSHEFEYLQRYLHHLGATAITGNNLTSGHELNDFNDFSDFR